MDLYLNIMVLIITITLWLAYIRIKTEWPHLLISWLFALSPWPSLKWPFWCKIWFPSNLKEFLLSLSFGSSWLQEWCLFFLFLFLGSGQQTEARQLSCFSPVESSVGQSRTHFLKPWGEDGTPSISTNSAWMVVEWIPLLWKNSFTFLATWKQKV